MGMRHWRGDGLDGSLTTFYLSPIVFYLMGFIVVLFGYLILALPLALSGIPESIYSSFLMYLCFIMFYLWVLFIGGSYIILTFENILSEKKIIGKVLKLIATIISVLISFLLLIIPFLLAELLNFVWIIKFINYLKEISLVSNLIIFILIFYALLLLVSFITPIKKILINKSTILIHKLHLKKLSETHSE